MVESFLAADVVQMYGNHLSGKTYTLNKLTDLLHYSYDRIVLAECEAPQIAHAPDARPNIFRSVQVERLVDLAAFALPHAQNLLVIDDYDMYGTSSQARRENAQQLLQLKQHYQKILLSTPTVPQLDPRTGRHVVFKLNHIVEGTQQFIRITHQTQHTSIDCFLLSLSRTLKLRHLL